MQATASAVFGQMYLKEYGISPSPPPFQKCAGGIFLKVSRAQYFQSATPHGCVLKKGIGTWYALLFCIICCLCGHFSSFTPICTHLSSFVFAFPQFPSLVHVYW